MFFDRVLGIPLALDCPVLASSLPSSFPISLSLPHLSSTFHSDLVFLSPCISFESCPYFRKVEGQFLDFGRKQRSGKL